MRRVSLGLGFKLLGFREFKVKYVWTAWNLQFWVFRASGPRNRNGTIHERPQDHLGHSGLHFGYRSGIVLSNLGRRLISKISIPTTSTPLLKPKLPKPALERSREPSVTMATVLY